MDKELQIKEHLRELLGTDIDTDTLDYFQSVISDSTDESAIKESLIPLLEANGVEDAEELCSKLCDRLQVKKTNSTIFDTVLLSSCIQLSQVAKSQISEAEQAQIDAQWGFDKIRAKKNDVIEMTEAGSAKYERHAEKEQKRWLAELEEKFIGEEDSGEQVSVMTLPDYSGNNREKDIHVQNFNITFGGKLLLENADLRLVFGRRYGLVGKNGVGKTTLLRHMANFDIEGFPRHHRVLHVKQEVQASEATVLQTVLASDVERNELLNQEAALIERQQSTHETNIVELQSVLSDLSSIQERLEQIGAHAAESRAAAILSGLQFSDEMQQGTTSSLSGGWRMRVALASALFIEPDLLMLDEPTNHLDLEAVLWLQEYLLSYPNSILLVSHDRSFLNDVCTDIVLFKNQKLTYYRGNFDSFEGTRREEMIVQQKQHDAQSVKMKHMQEFVDKFRFNAKRASLVQSRIKAIERETIVEAVEEEKEFSFTFADSGELGRPVIQLEGVTFGYGSSGLKNPLFRSVHKNIDQSSRIALVGPNGAGKSTLLKLIQGELRTAEGRLVINPQLRLGIFTQHHMDCFDLQASALSNMISRYPKVHEQDLRSHLGRFEIQGTDALKPMKYLSGGQKSKVAFANLTFLKPHVILLDEPTNHLDMETINALAGALETFSGGVLIISHDQFFIKRVCKEIWVIGDGEINDFRQSFDDYKKLALASHKRHIASKK